MTFALNDLRVVAGVLSDATGRVLIAKRPFGKSLAGRWEFPGGKIDAGESQRAALGRELMEELGIEVLTAEPLMVVRHQYSSAMRGVQVSAWRVTAWHGTPRPLDSQELHWCLPTELSAMDLLEADRPIITALCLPPHLVRVSSQARLASYLASTTRTDPVAWLLSEAPIDSLREQIEAGRHAYFVMHAQTDPCAYVGGNTQWVGRCVSRVAECAAALIAGADFLIVHQPVMSVDDWQTLDTLNVPWYASADDLSGDMTPTGAVIWDGDAWIGARLLAPS